MYHRHHSPSEGFRHVCRSLRSGEQLPALPGLIQQIESYRCDLVRLAALDAAEAAEIEPEEDDGFDIELDEAA